MTAANAHSTMATPSETVVLVSHGSPSDPDPQERDISELARKVGARLPGCDLRGATLAAKGALDGAVAGLSNPIIFPHFMADGWFVSSQLPKRLRAAGLAQWRMAPPLGLLPNLPDLALGMCLSIMEQNRLPAGKTVLIVAAHGSPSDPRPAQATYGFAKALKRSGAFRDIRVGFVDETPSLEDAARVEGPALLLPFFAARAGHVLMDLPEAVEAARFEGPVLAPIGTWPSIPRLIAQGLTDHLTARAA